MHVHCFPIFCWQTAMNVRMFHVTLKCYLHKLYMGLFYCSCNAGFTGTAWFWSWVCWYVLDFDELDKSVVCTYVWYCPQPISFIYSNLLSDLREKYHTSKGNKTVSFKVQHKLLTILDKLVELITQVSVPVPGSWFLHCHCLHYYSWVSYRLLMN